MKIKIESINSVEFQSFINKLASIAPGIYFKIQENELRAYTYIPQRDAVKIVNAPVEEVFNNLKIEGEYDTEKKIKISFFDASTVIESLKQFDGDFEAVITFEERESDYIATKFTIKNKELTINLSCSDPGLLFNELSEEQIANLSDTANPLWELALTRDTLKKLINLNKLDLDEFFSLVSDDNVIYSVGKTFKKELGTADDVEDFSAKLRKKYLQMLDNDDFRIYMNTNKCIVKAENSHTYLILSLAVSNA